jgi:glutamate-5-semialdehyde dehydrogenase
MAISGSAPALIAQAASVASRTLAVLPAEQRNSALTVVHHALAASKDMIFAANASDVFEAKRAANAGLLSQSVVERLDLARPGKWEDMLQGILDVRGLQDPGKFVSILSSPSPLIMYESCK